MMTGSPHNIKGHCLKVTVYSLVHNGDTEGLLGSRRVQTCGESNGYLELNLNCSMNFSPSYKVLSGPSI